MYDPARVIPFFRYRCGRPHGPGPYLSLVPIDPNRVYLAITNVLPSVLWLWPEPPDRSDRGHIAVAPSETFEMQWGFHGMMVSHAWWASSEESAVEVYILEAAFHPPGGTPWVVG